MTNLWGVGFCDGLDAGQGGGFGGFLLGGFGPFFEEDLGDRLFAGWFYEFGDRGYVAEDFVVEDLFDGLDGRG
jgi:hypothetical protein